MRLQGLPRSARGSAALTPSLAGFENNHLIRALPIAIRARWASNLTRTELPVGMVLADPGETIANVVFPTTAIVSLLSTTTTNAQTEIAVVGKEGMVGIALLMGGGSTPTGAVVNTAGEGYRMDAATFRTEISRSTVVLHLLLRYTQALITQLAQTAVCNRHHSLHQQLSRLLLLILDRSPDNELNMTHGAIADTLGVRRESVTEAAQQLQRAGLIRYSRGHVSILDRHGLELTSCECYQVVKREYDRLLPQLDATPPR
jgi:CRP-like cAMP-binding protein